MYGTVLLQVEALDITAFKQLQLLFGGMVCGWCGVVYGWCGVWLVWCMVGMVHTCGVWYGIRGYGVMCPCVHRKCTCSHREVDVSYL